MNAYETLVEALEDNLTDDRSITFIEGKHDETEVSYKDLHARALVTLHHFQKRDLKPGDFLIFFLKKNEKFVDAYWACLLGGIIPVPVAVGISDEHRSKLLRIFKRLEKAHLYTDNKSLEMLKKYAEHKDCLGLYKKIEQHTILEVDIADDVNLGELYIPKPDDIAFIQFSSGSTRDPKGVPLTHRNLTTTIKDLGNRAAYQADETSLSWMPLTHDLGLIGFHINMLAFGMNQNLMATDLFSRRPLIWLQKASEKRANILTSPNFGFKHYLKVYQNRKTEETLDLSCIRLILNGAEPISVSLCDEFLDTMAKYNLKRSAMYPSYGLAEAGLAVSLPIPGNEFEYVNLQRSELRMGEPVQYTEFANPDALSFAIEGPPVEECQVRIVDDENNIHEKDVIGEIQIKGPNVTSGYFNDDEATQNLLTDDGWLKTGDLGFFYDKQLVIAGRLKDIIFANGQNYYPHDLEAITLQSDKLELGKVVALGTRKNNADHDDILICILFRDDIKAFMPIVKEVIHLINEQAGLEVAHVIPVTRIPKTTSGKIQRRFFEDAYLNGEYDEINQSIDTLLKTSKSPTITEEDLTATEAMIKSICDTVFEDKQLNIDDNFFDTGISSLQLAQVHERINEDHPDVLDIIDMFDHATIRELAKFLDTKLSN